MGHNVPLKSHVSHPIGRRQALTDPIFGLKRLMLQAFCDKGYESVMKS